MASANDCFELLKYRTNKAGYNGYISPSDFNLLFPRGEIRYYNRLYADYYKTQRISDSLSKFLTDPIALTLATTGGTAGQYTLLSDVFHVDAITHTLNGLQYPVARVEKDRLANWLSSQVQAPSAQFPIYTEFKTYLQFYPLTLGTATLIYLKQPTTTVWGYNLNGILTTTTLVAGTLYTTGTYTNVPLTGGSGTGARATIVVSGGGVFSVMITTSGNNYVVGNVLSASAANIGTTGSGFSITVLTVSGNRPVYNPVTSVAPIWSDTDIDNIIYLVMDDLGINMKDPQVAQFAQVQEKEAR